MQEREKSPVKILIAQDTSLIAALSKTWMETPTESQKTKENTYSARQKETNAGKNEQIKQTIAENKQKLY